MTIVELSNRVRRTALIALLRCGFLILTPCASLAAGTATLAWNPSVGTNIIANYKVYYGVASATYTNTVSAGTNLTVTISNLVRGTTYYFAATAIDVYGLESDFSSEASALIPASSPNQPPTLDPVLNLVFNENAGPQVVNLSGITSGATNEAQTLTVTASSSNTGLIPTPAVGYTSPNTTGTLTLSPIAYANGVSTITVTVNDGGASNNTISRTFTATVLPVNQPPTLNAIANLTLNENTGLQTVALSGITSGAANEPDTLVVTASSSNPALIPTPTVNYTSPNTTGSISFTPVANANGAATITVTVNDGGASNNVSSRSFVVTVNSVNQAPTLNPLANLTIEEDAGLQTIALSGITSGSADEAQTLTVTATSSNTRVIPDPTVSYTSPSLTGSLAFTPVLLANGVATITVTVNDGGSSNNIVSRQFDVTVKSVNNFPTLDPLADLTLNENAGLQTVNLAGIGSGAPNENQGLTVTGASSNPGLIPNPTVTYTSPNTSGALTFTPVAYASGSSRITVTVNDGGASNNVLSREFTVTVRAVNQAPTLNPLPDLTISENASQQTVSLSGISSGAPNEDDTLTVTASSSNTGLIPTPTVAYVSRSASGSINFTPVANTHGSAIITVKVNDGGASNNLVAQSFTVTVTAVGSRPADCVYALSLSPTVFSANAAIGAFNVAAGSSCTWSIVAPAWVTLSSTNGSGGYAGALSVDANPGSSRVGVVTLISATTNLSCSLTQQAVTAGAVALATPLDGSTLQSARPEFSWTLSSPAADKYYLQLSRDGRQYLSQWIEGTTNWTTPSDVPAGAYSWTVEAANATGAGPLSTNSSFTVPAITLPSALTLVSPTGEAGVSGPQRFLWTTVAGATRYELYIERDGIGFLDRWFNLTDSVVDVATGNFAVDVPGIGSGTYLWWARASGPAGDGPWSGPTKVFFYRAQ